MRFRFIKARFGSIRRQRTSTCLLLDRNSAKALLGHSFFIRHLRNSTNLNTIVFVCRKTCGWIIRFRKLSHNHGLTQFSTKLSCLLSKSFKILIPRGGIKISLINARWDTPNKVAQAGLRICTEDTRVLREQARLLFHTYRHQTRHLLLRCIPTTRISYFLWCTLALGFFCLRSERTGGGLGHRLCEKVFALFRNVQSSATKPIRCLDHKQCFFRQHERELIVTDNSTVSWIEFLRDMCVGSRVLSLRTIEDFLNDLAESAWQLFLGCLWAMLFCSIRASNKVGFSFSLRKGSDRFCKVLDEPFAQFISVSIGVKC